MDVSSDAASEWMVSGPGAQRRILCHDKNVMMVEFRFDKGGEGLPHNHPHVQTTYVASGRFEFTVGDDTKVLEKGDAMLVPSNVVHSCVCLEDGVLFDAFSPRRDDFLEMHGMEKT